MNRRERLETAWSFKEPDRVPIELAISPEARTYPEAARVKDFMDNEADNFVSTPAANWGFFNIPVIEKTEETIEDIPGEYYRKKRTMRTEAGDFYAITKHSYSELIASDYHWERRYIETFDDMKRLAEAPKKFNGLFEDLHQEKIRETGDSAVALHGISHPLGALVRLSNMTEVYGWLAGERKVIHQFLESTNAAVIETVEKMAQAGMGPYYSVCAHEMLIPPWISLRMFDEYVFNYDKPVNDVIHKHGGKLRAHCHDKVSDLLEKFHEMGIDALEPLEPPPFGDVDLADAKQRMGGKMLLSGNIPSQNFLCLDPPDVEALVREAIQKAAPGGGFTLRTTGGHAATNSFKSKDQLMKILTNIEAYIDAGLKYGKYPIQG